ncbi:MAG TPA: DUF1467 family protein [Alphaproteobacteria bacterium]|nr:DUF1467 family protein [Alphaproteobacteria bacterium]
MTLFSYITVFILIWWIVLFCVLPLDIQNITKPKDGSMPGAPARVNMKRKLIVTTVIAVVLWCGACALIASNLISFSAIAAKMPV